MIRIENAFSVKTSVLSLSQRLKNKSLRTGENENSQSNLKK